jgi:hypothetical protein
MLVRFYNNPHFNLPVFYINPYPDPFFEIHLSQIPQGGTKTVYII